MYDNGSNPYVVNIVEKTLANENYRATLWTGSNLQLTLMSIQPDDSIGLELHDDHDQFLRIEQGTALVQMGKTEDSLDKWEAHNDDAIFVPAGTWHDIVNIGTEPLKIYSIYAPPEHPHGTVHQTKADDLEHQ
ncbi:MAG: cupin domain-containing protein [Candidatus Saccharimonadales bacterium]